MLTQTHQATKADPILCELRETILQGRPNTFREISKNLQPYWSYRDELVIENGILMKSAQIIIPKVMQSKNPLWSPGNGKNVSCEPKAAFFWATSLGYQQNCARMCYLSRTTESPMCRILKTARNFSETIANSIHGFVSGWQIALHADSWPLFKISP